MMMNEKMLERRFSFGGGVSVKPVWRDPIRRDDDDDEDDDDDDDVDDDEIRLGNTRSTPQIQFGM